MGGGLMKYSIKGNFKTKDDATVINIINQFFIYKLAPQKTTDEVGNPLFIFEAWLPNLLDKNNLYNQLKLKVDELGGSVSWHECTHDEDYPQPCVLIEEYRG
jgi:hypothetical protein